MEYGLSVATVFAIMVVLAMSCYVVILAGEISFGQHAFFGVGAYVAATFTVFLGSDLATALAAGAAAAALLAFAAGLPILRAHGFQFTIYTLVFAEFVRQVMLKAEWRVMRDGREIGPQGMMGFSGIDYFFEAGIGVGGQALLSSAVAVAAIVAVGALRRSHFGRMIEAVAADPQLAAAAGIDPRTTRLAAFAISGGLAGLGGGLFAHYATYINPENFGLMFGVHAVAYTLLGGVGSVLGPVLGAALDIVLLEQLRVFGGYRMIVFGALVVCILILRPRGLVDRPLPALLAHRRHVMPCIALVSFLAVAVGGAASAAAQTPVELTFQAQPTGVALERRLVIGLRDGDRPVTGATVEVHVDMPSMPMMHRVPKATATAGDAPGEYTAKVTLEMPGEWAARIVVDKPRRTTVVRKFRVD